MSLHKPRILVILAAAWLLFAPVMVVLGNSGPPDTTVLLTFDYVTTSPVVLQGIQLVGCDTLACAQPTLLQQYGACTDQGCLPVTEPIRQGQPSECLGNSCLLSYYKSYGDAAPLLARLLVQYSDGLRKSDVFPDSLTLYGANAWRVTVHDASLSAVKDDSNKSLLGAHERFWGFFVLTLVAELAVAAVALVLAPKSSRGNAGKGLVFVALANLLSYPVTWTFWPAMAQFQKDSSRRGGLYVAVVALVCAAGLVSIVRAEGKARRRRIIAAIGIAVLGVVVVPVVGLMLTYGRTHISLHGLPFGVTVLLAEVFAVVFETLLLYLLARKSLKLPIWQCAALSLVMNIASYLLGRWVLMG